MLATSSLPSYGPALYHWMPRLSCSGGHPLLHADGVPLRMIQVAWTQGQSQLESCEDTNVGQNCWLNKDQPRKSMRMTALCGDPVISPTLSTTCDQWSSDWDPGTVHSFAPQSRCFGSPILPPILRQVSLFPPIVDPALLRPWRKNGR